MKKLKMFVVALLFAGGLLTSCNAKTHTVEFYASNLGDFYVAVTVNHNDKVARPAVPPAPTNFKFDAWYADTLFAKKFDFTLPITKDTRVFAKWEQNKPYVADERIFHVVGELNNPELDYINWNAGGEEGVNYDARSYLTKDEHTNLYTIELQIGALGEFKVKVAGAAWDTDLEFGYSSIDPRDYNEHIDDGDSGNIKVLTAGLYKIQVETTFEWAKVVRLSD